MGDVHSVIKCVCLYRRYYILNRLSRGVIYVVLINL